MVFQLVTLLMEPQNRDVGRKLFLFTIAMFTLPILAFYAAKKHLFAADDPKADMWSGFISVAAVNVIIACYVVMAFLEDKDEAPAAAGAGARAAGGGRPGVVAGSKERTD